MKNICFPLALLILCLSTNAQNIIPDFSSVDNQNSIFRFSKVIAVDDKLAIVAYDEIDQSTSELLILDQDGAIETSINLKSDTTGLSARLISDGENIILIGKTFTPGLSIDSTDQASRLFTYKSYDGEGNTINTTLLPVDPQDIGLESSSVFTGITVDVVLYTTFSSVAASNPKIAIEALETLIIEDNNDVSQYFNVFNIFNIESDSLLTIVDTGSIYRTIVDVVAIDSFAYLYAISGQTLDAIRSVHRVDLDGTITALEEPEDIYFFVRLVQYAEVMDDKIVEIAALASGNQGQNIGATRMKILDRNRNELLSKIIANDRAPFGESSLAIGKDSSIYAATVDVINRDNLPIQIQKLDANDLTEIWNIPLSRDTFGLFQSMAPTSDGGLVVVGSEQLPNQLYELYITKIDFSGVVSTMNFYSETPDWLQGPNPTNGILYFQQKHLSVSEEYTYEVFNLKGQLLKQNRLRNNSIDISILPSGQYICQIKNINGKVMSSSRIIKY